MKIRNEKGSSRLIELKFIKFFDIDWIIYYQLTKLALIRINMNTYFNSRLNKLFYPALSLWAST